MARADWHLCLCTHLDGRDCVSWMGVCRANRVHGDGADVDWGFEWPSQALAVECLSVDGGSFVFVVLVALAVACLV